VPGAALKGNFVQHGFSGFVFKRDVGKLYRANNATGGLRAACIFVFRCFVEHLMHAVQAGESFNDLRSKSYNLKHWRDHESHIRRELKETAQTHFPAHQNAAAHDHDGDADQPHHQRGKQPHRCLSLQRGRAPGRRDDTRLG
jgi:hypothetical protein